MRPGHAQQVLEPLPGLEIYLLELTAAVTHLHHRHAAAVPVEQLSLRLLQNGLRHLRRTRREIISPILHFGHILFL